MRSTAPVVPDARIGSQGSDCWHYELCPANDLPVVDLSVSLRSRYFSKNGLARATKCMRHERFFFLCFAVGGVLHIGMFFSQDVGLIQPLAVVSGLLMLPSPLIGIIVLRFEVVRLLVKTYDFWFFFATNVIFFALFSPLLRDARVFAAFVFSVGSTTNLLADANLRGARRLVQGNIGVFFASLLFIFSLKIDWIVALYPFDLVRYGAHALPAQALAESCQLTLTAMTARNIFRGRQALRQGVMYEIRCVSLRSALRIQPVRNSAPVRQGANSSQPERVSVTKNGNHVSHAAASPLQQLRCVLSIGPIDSRTTVVRGFFMTIARSHSAQNLIRLVATCAFAATVVAAFVANYNVESGKTSPASNLQLVATSLTAAFVGASTAVYLRTVFRAIASSFDFLYVSTLLTVVHLTACDFFRWRSSPCLVVATSWLWIHWALCVDALSPLVKNAFRVHVRFPAVVITTAIAASGLLLYRRIVLDTSDEPYDRVLWSGVVLRRRAAVRVVPVFYNCLGSALVFSMRLLYHAWRFDADMLMVLDGPGGVHQLPQSNANQLRISNHERVRLQL